MTNNMIDVLKYDVPIHYAMDVCTVKNYICITCFIVVQSAIFIGLYPEFMIVNNNNALE